MEGIESLLLGNSPSVDLFDEENTRTRSKFTAAVGLHSKILLISSILL